MNEDSQVSGAYEPGVVAGLWVGKAVDPLEELVLCAGVQGCRRFTVRRRFGIRLARVQLGVVSLTRRQPRSLHRLA
jgi:hypothetical protein